MRLSAESRYCLWALLAFVASAVAWDGLVQLQVGVPTGMSSYYWSIIRSKSEAARRAGTPKIVLLGESGTYYGIRADVMGRELGVPTVNLAMTASLGPRYIMWNAKRDLKPGDTVLLTIEYQLLCEGDEVGPTLVNYVYERDPSYILTLPLVDRLAMPLRLSPHRLALGLINRVAGKRSEHWLGLTPNALAFTTALGDGLYRSSAQTEKDTYWLSRPIDFDPGGPSSALSQDIAEFAGWCRSHGVRRVLSYPAVAWGTDLETPAARTFFAKLERFYASVGAEVQGTPESFFYDRSWFQDSRVHLKLRYAVLHTQQRAKTLLPLLPLSAREAASGTGTAAKGDGGTPH